MKIGLIGNGAIARYVAAAAVGQGHQIGAMLLRPTRVAQYPGTACGAVAYLPVDLDVMIDCAGHGALASHGPAILERGTDLITVSLGALADPAIHQTLDAAAAQGQATLHLASGAIGALDCLAAARTGTLESVTYTGRKPPQGWLGSPAENALDIAALTHGHATHFEGSARDAALKYPKNANVAAAVALAGIGFDDTQVRLIADADIAHNIHEVTAKGEFGQFRFEISGNALPDNPKSSALAAMSVVRKLAQLSDRITL